MTDRPDIDAIRRRADAAAPAPWHWRGNVDIKSVRLWAPRSRGRMTVLDFTRWGMQNAAPQFTIAGLLHRADELAIYEVCPEATSRRDSRVYRGDIIGLRHPDAEFLAHARQDVEDLLAYVAELESALERQEGAA